MNISYRSVDLNDPVEMSLIAATDMTIPALYDSLFKVNEKTISERLSQLLRCKPDDFFEVAINSDGKIVGYHALTQFKTPHGLMAADIQTLWVDPEFRRIGIAKTLKTRGEAWARAKGLHHIATFVSAKNERMASLNNENGFELLGYRMRKLL
jgi:ribosomal protein S18 acetylase RimI-like enzyme